MKMFNEENNRTHIGHLKKADNLKSLEPVEKYFLKSVKKHKLEWDYDCVADEVPWFRTFSYCEFAGCFMMYPLAPILRNRQIREAYEDSYLSVDYIKYLKSRIETKSSNKYKNRVSTNLPHREHLIIPVGGNKLKETVCINKVKYIVDSHKDNVYLKPHPLTEHRLVGELKDILGDDVVLDRDVDVYELLPEAKVVHTSHRSESIVYATALGKEIDCIDTYQKANEGSFFHVADPLFEARTIEDRQRWIQRIFNSYKSGIVNPDLDEDWQAKIDNYLAYILTMRDEYKNKYVWNKSGTMEWSKKK